MTGGAHHLETCCNYWPSMDDSVGGNLKKEDNMSNEDKGLDPIIEHYRLEQARLLKLASDLSESKRSQFEQAKPEPSDSELVASVEKANSLGGSGRLKPADALKIGRIRNRKEQRKLDLGLKYTEPPSK